MSSDLEDFHHQFLQEVRGFADADGQFLEDSFFDIFTDYLIEVGEVSTADRARLEGRGYRVDGYGGDPSQSDGILTLFVVDCTQSTDLGTLSKTEMDTIFKRLEGFVSKSLDERFRRSLEETTAAFGLADMIQARWGELNKIRLILLTDRQLSTRIDRVMGEDAGGIPVTRSVWDMNRLHRLVSSGQGREEMSIELERDFGGSIPVLKAHLDAAGYEAYLAVLSGSQLAAIYDRWTTRLLEQNVRVFLQARGKVNQGIRNTLDDEPDRFFAYNNGITATAESVETKKTDDGLVITSLTNLQIVNGGQTTASIHAAMRDKKRPVDLSRVFVQMKLSIIQHDQAMQIVPLISQYANTQNKVSAADFFSNHPFHVRIEEFSRRVYAPSADGALRESHWFYERARGQYRDQRSRLAGREQRKFDEDYPRSQVFSKTDLAKFEMVWRLRPDIVSGGAQKNFAHFAGLIAEEWDANESRFNEDYYTHLIAKAIIFRATERLVTAQPWYEGGYRANVVAYAIAKLAQTIAQRGNCLAFDTVWREQSLPEVLERALVAAASAVHNVIIDPPAGTRNVTEWAKKEACWSRVESLQIAWPEDLGEVLISLSEARLNARAAVQDQRMLNGIQAQAAVVNAGAAYWRRLKRWGESRGRLTERESSIMQVMISSGYVSEAQAAVLVEAVERLREEGCIHAREFGA